MKVDGKDYRAVWAADDEPGVVRIIDQRLLPHSFKIIDLNTVEDAIQAIQRMAVRGAPLIGATGAWAVYLALFRDEGTVDPDRALAEYCAMVSAARPTAVNLAWAVNRVKE
ncbi:MAG: S-methyl-5-thioribose-1-phosphate isomerase, partial [Thermodesulfobacteriota bacterium]